jgi:murein L,D-transpeptidase YcbB/YkuD
LVKSWPLVLIVLLNVACGRLQVADNNAPSDAQMTLRAALADAARPSFVTSDGEGARLWKLTRAFYERRSHQLAWIDEKHPTEHMDALIDALKGADLEGLDPEMYSLSALEARREEAAKGLLRKKGFDPDQAGRLDVFLTYLYMKYASDLADGISDLAQADKAWRIQPERFEPLDHLERALAESRVGESLQELTPDAPQYKQLRESLATYRKAVADGGWPAVPKKLRVKHGQTSDDVLLLAKRLAASGDYTGNVPDTGALAYDDGIVEAVKRFQRRHGLEDDGNVGPQVIAEMNVPVEKRLEQIRLSLERWRWLPRDLGDPHILVNIPGYLLEVWEHGKVPVRMRVVVGRKDTPTPIFNDRMTHIVFSPYWNVPSSIAQGETLPAVLRDAAFLERNNMELLDAAGNKVDPASTDLSDPTKYRFRQRPGSNNSLGLVKFMFPNEYSVYLHDTPADSLFARATRSFSHGCVRVEDPVTLAQYLLRDQPEWTKERIDEAMHAGEEKTVKLPGPLPVYLGYWTAWATSDGVYFTRDVYGHDARQSALVAQRAARLKHASEKGVASGEPAAAKKHGK